MVKHCAVIHDRDSITVAAAMSEGANGVGGSDSGRTEGGQMLVVEPSVNGGGSLLGNPHSLGSSGRGGSGGNGNGRGGHQSQAQEQQQQQPDQQQEQRQQEPHHRVHNNPYLPGQALQHHMAPGADGAPFRGARPRHEQPAANANVAMEDSAATYLTAANHGGPGHEIGPPPQGLSPADTATTAAAQVLATVATSGPFPAPPVPGAPGQQGGYPGSTPGSGYGSGSTQDQPGGGGSGGGNGEGGGGGGPGLHPISINRDGDRGRGGEAGLGGTGVGDDIGVDGGGLLRSGPQGRPGHGGLGHGGAGGRGGGGGTRGGGGRGGGAGGEDTPNVCPLCGLGFRVACALAEHERVVHGVPF